MSSLCYPASASRSSSPAGSSLVQFSAFAAEPSEWNRPHGQLVHGLVSGGLSAALVWAVTMMPQHISMPIGEQATVWLLLLSWLGYWGLKDWIFHERE